MVVGCDGLAYLNSASSCPLHVNHASGRYSTAHPAQALSATSSIGFRLSFVHGLGVAYSNELESLRFLSDTCMVTTHGSVRSVSKVAMINIAWFHLTGHAVNIIVDSQKLIRCSLPTRTLSMKGNAKYWNLPWCGRCYLERVGAQLWLSRLCLLMRSRTFPPIPLNTPKSP